jgi:hypothetical protein
MCKKDSVIFKNRTVEGVRLSLCVTCNSKIELTIKKDKVAKVKEKKKVARDTKKLSRKNMLTLLQKLARVLDGDKCCTCDKVFTESNIAHGGHGVKAQKNMFTAFLLQNIHAQCASCNIFLDGSQYNYGNFVNKTYGHGTFEKIQHLSNKVQKIPLTKIQELRTKAEEYILLGEGKTFDEKWKLRLEFIKWQEKEWATF